MTETTNCLGLDKFQIAIIKGNYNSAKPMIAKRNKLHEKISAATEKMEKAIQDIRDKTKASLDDIMKEMAVYREQIEALDNITKTHTQRACGIELTSEQAIKFLEDPQAFEEYKKGLGLEGDLFSQEAARDLDAEEDKEWEDRIASGELKEIV